MQLGYKDFFFKIFAPIFGTVIAILLFNINSLTNELFFGFILLGFVLSIIGGAFVYFFFLLYGRYELTIIKEVKTRFNGDQIDENTIKFKYENIIVYFKRTMDFKSSQSQFSFHIPTKYIPKENRKEFKFKPSKINNDECFNVRNWFYVYKKRLDSLELLLKRVVAINN